MPMSPRLLRPRASGFNPKSISGLKLWLDIANTSSLTFNGSTVSQVNDLSGNNFHATQGTANNQPTYSATGLNSKPALSFDATDSLLSTATIADVVANAASSPAITIVAVTFSASASAGFAAGSDNAANGRVFVSAPFDNTGASYLDIAGTAGGRLAFTVTSAQQAAPSVYVFQRNGADMSVRRNGTVLASKANASQTFSATTAKFQIGQAIGLTGFTCTLSEVLCYSAGLTATQVSEIEKAIGKKWGVTVA